MTGILNVIAAGLMIVALTLNLVIGGKLGDNHPLIAGMLLIGVDLFLFPHIYGREAQWRLNIFGHALFWLKLLVGFAMLTWGILIAFGVLP